jgi:hypothetical protein
METCWTVRRWCPGLLGGVVEQESSKGAEAMAFVVLLCSIVITSLWGMFSLSYVLERFGG